VILGRVDREQPDEVDEAARVEEVAVSPAVAAEPSSVNAAPVFKSDASNITLEPGIVADLVRRPDEVTPEGTRLVEMTAASPDVVEEPSSVQITPLVELNPSITALEPEVASQLDGRADEVIVQAAACESPAAQPSNTAAQLSDERLDSSIPVTAACSPDPPDADVADPPQVCTRTFPAVVLSIADARRFAVQALADSPAQVLDDIRLMVSELASNAIEHAMSGFELTVRRSRQEIRVEVSDSGAGTPTLRATGPDAPKGRGLQIVDTVSTHWGVERESDSAKTVWFTGEFAQTAGPTPSA
jgi:serine/threonine-protein kinase RsbW